MGKVLQSCDESYRTIEILLLFCHKKHTNPQLRASVFGIETTFYSVKKPTAYTVHTYIIYIYKLK